MRFGAAGVILALVWSGIDPRDRATWWMEVAPVFIAIPVLLFTYRRFTLTPLLYYLIGLHALVLIVGGAYTYAHVPFGYQLQDAFALSRNPYDKIGHFMQGFVPTLIAREILLRVRCVSGRGMAGFLSVCVAVAVSAVYEMIEWGAALALGEGANEFLGMQGDPWDTQSDMFMALLGALAALASLGRLHNRQLAQIENSNARRVT